MILSKKEEQDIISGFKKIQKIAKELAEWGDMDYREEAQKIESIAKTQLKIFIKNKN